MKKINFFALLLAGIFNAQTNFVLIKDINEGSGNSAPSNFAILDGKLYFAAISSNIGNELWSTDGTSAGTVLVQDYLSGSASSAPTNLFAYNNKIYFYATSITSGTSTSGTLCSYDTTNGISMLSTNSKFPVYFTDVDSRLYFKATDATNSARLFYLEGSNGPILADNGVTVNTLGKANGKLIANAQYTTAANPTWYQFFGFDGSNFNLIRTINPTSSSYPQNFYTSSALGKTFFNANNGSGNELWITDGTEVGTNLVKDINTSTAVAGSGPANFVQLGNKVYFSASNGISGSELWSTDGTEQGTFMVKDIVQGSAGSFPEKLVQLNDKIYFLLTNTGNVRQLWESDGTETGTKLLSAIYQATNLVVYDNALYLTGRVTSNDTIGLELYRVDMGTGTLSSSNNYNKYKKAEIFPNPSSGHIQIKNFGIGDFELYDMNGKLVQKGKYGPETIVFLNCKSGVYQLKTISQTIKATASTKIIVK